MPLYAGVCETNITPPLGVWMCGYAFRPSGCTAVHDELYARALVLNDGRTSVAILAMDLLGLDFDLVQQVREGIAKQTGLAPEAILLNATHTHGGPNVREFNCMGSRDPAYIDVLVRKLIGVAVQAANQLQPASVAYGTAPAQIGVNRRQTSRTGGPTHIGRNYAGPVDSRVRALVVLDSRGEPFALLFSHACHPTTLGGENLQITADYPGVACEVIREELGGRELPFFLQGCAGNINPHPRGAYEDAARHGQTLAAAALEAADEAQPLESGDLSFAEKTISLSVLPPPSIEQCDRNIAEWRQKLEAERAGGHQGRILHAEGLLTFSEYERRLATGEETVKELPFAIQRVSLGGLDLLGMPGEMFVQYGLDFERQSARPLLALGYTNGVYGYVPTAADYPHGGYEVDGAYRYYGLPMYTPDCEPLIRRAAYELLAIEKPDTTAYAVQ